MEDWFYNSITPMWFMSDDAQKFFNAWRSVFGPVKNRLFCTWHVDRVLKLEEATLGS